MPTPEHQTTRIWTKTHRKLRLIAAFRGESLVQTLDRLADQELAQIERETGNDGLTRAAQEEGASDDG